MAKPRADLQAYWSKKENDIVYNWTGHHGGKANGHFLYNVLGSKVIEELDRRGFDVKTLRFSIRRKPGLEGCPECDQLPHAENCSRGKQNQQPTPPEHGAGE